MKSLRILLLPFSLLYGVITWIRNVLYDWKILPSYTAELPVICIGNLRVGGTGKTPHTEYLIRLLKNDYRVATLSRGYGRSTTGFAEVTGSSLASEVGDEPLQLKKKFGEEVLVCVDEDRKHGIQQILGAHPERDIILLDDAYQHRAVKAGLNILLSDYSAPFYSDYLLPAGNLRESRSGVSRADVVIFTKCPPDLEERKKEIIRKRFPGKTVLFSYLTYASPRLLSDLQEHPFPADLSGILLLSGIANNAPLKAWLEKQTTQLQVCEFPDHRNFSASDMDKMRAAFESMSEKNNIIVTSEKDTMRLLPPPIYQLIAKLPIYYVPIYIEFSEADREQFHHLTRRYVEENKKRS
jgi:tetraacyldisaccharide 4'-kinase